MRTRIRWIRNGGNSSLHSKRTLRPRESPGRAVLEAVQLADPLHGELTFGAVTATGHRTRSPLPTSDSTLPPDLGPRTISISSRRRAIQSAR